MAAELGTLTKELFDLVRSYAYQFCNEPFRLASGKYSQHYFNCKKITMCPDRLSLLANAICDEVIPGASMSVPQAVGGLTLGADPIAYALSLAYLQRSHYVYPVVVRKATKDHGTGKLIEAEFDHSQVQEILVLEDTVTSGGSALQAVNSLRQLGFAVRHCLAIVDRQEGGYEALNRQGVSLISLFQAKDFCA